VFSEGGRYRYVGNPIDQSISILCIEGGRSPGRQRQVADPARPSRGDARPASL